MRREMEMTAPQCELPSDADWDASAALNMSESDLLELIYLAGLRDDNRKSPRRKVRISVPTVPVDEEGRPLGDHFVAESRNLSATGICMVHTEAVSSKYLMVQLPGPRLERQSVGVEVLRCRPVDGGYEIAGPFVTLPRETAATDPTQLPF